MAPLFVLVHSPLVGPATWELVGAVLREGGSEVVIPTFRDPPTAEPPYWSRHAAAVAEALAGWPSDRPLVWVGHSGAGPLLPALRAAVPHPAAAYVFVDAGLPQAGTSRLDMFQAEDPEQAALLEADLQGGGAYPTWSDADLQHHLPEARHRQVVLDELQPRRLPYWTEPLPVAPDWPDAPCAYLQLSAAYDQAAADAGQAGWPTHHLASHHFALLTDAPVIAAAILALIAPHVAPATTSRGTLL